MKMIMKKMLHPIVFFAFAFGLGTLGYLAASLLLPWPPFAGLYRMFMYHKQHPFQYIAVIAVCYALVASIWAWTVGSKQKGLIRWITIATLIPATILLASFPGGVLWSWHDMQAGFVPAFWFRKLMRGGVWGVETGWLVVGLSFPYNICGTVAGVLVTDIVERILRRTNDGRLPSQACEPAP
jgi:hypothetical protein